MCSPLAGALIRRVFRRMGERWGRIVEDIIYLDTEAVAAFDALADRAG